MTSIECLSFIPLCYLAIAIEFGRNSYRVLEGDGLSVCVVLIGETDQPVQVTLTSVQNSALGSNLSHIWEELMYAFNLHLLYRKY